MTDLLAGLIRVQAQDRGSGALFGRDCCNPGNHLLRFRANALVTADKDHRDLLQAGGQGAVS